MIDINGSRMIGPLAPYVQGFLAELSRLGYTAVSAGCQIQLMSHTSRWAAEHHFQADDLTPEVIDQFLAVRRAEGRREWISQGGMKPLLPYLRSIGVVPEPEQVHPTTKLERLLEEYRTYLSAERGLAPDTIPAYMAVARLFLSQAALVDRPSLADLSGADQGGWRGLDTGIARDYAAVMDVDSGAIKPECSDCVIIARLQAAQSRVAELEAQVASLQGQKAALGEMAFHHSERRQRMEPIEATAVAGTGSDVVGKRGQRRGAGGHGRRQHPELPTVDVVLEPSPTELHCATCSAPFVRDGRERVSEEIRRRVIYERVVTHRPLYVPTCEHFGESFARVAALPPRVIPRGELAPGILANLLVDKFDLSIPLERTLRMFAYEGLYLAKGSVTGMFQRMSSLFEPVYDAMREHLLGAGIWHVDETRWLVFVEQKHKWWMWGAVGPDVVIFVIDPHRNADALHRLLPEKPGGQGVVISDRYAVYGPNTLDPEHYRIQYCWVHLRRDFVRAARADASLKPWSLAWLRRIRILFHWERERRRAAADGPEYAQADVALRSWVKGIRRTLSTQLNTIASTRAFDVLHSFDERFANYTVFLDHPGVPLDNNAAERALRTPVLGRKNFYGSRSNWAVHQTEMLESIFATLRRHGLSPLAWTVAFLTACAENRGQPLPSISRFLPWAMGEEDRKAWALPRGMCAQGGGTHRARDDLEETG